LGHSRPGRASSKSTDVCYAAESGSKFGALTVPPGGRDLDRHEAFAKLLITRGFFLRFISALVGPVFERQKTRRPANLLQDEFRSCARAFSISTAYYVTKKNPRDPALERAKKLHALKPHVEIEAAEEAVRIVDEKRQQAKIQLGDIAA
jgi:hypothetical protein